MGVAKETQSHDLPFCLVALFPALSLALVLTRAVEWEEGSTIKLVRLWEKGKCRVRPVL